MSYCIHCRLTGNHTVDCVTQKNQKTRTMRYFIARVVEHNGDMEYSSEYLFQTSGSPDRYATKVARGWRGDPKAEYAYTMRGYWCDGTIVREAGYKEVPVEHFDVLSKYLVVL